MKPIIFFHIATIGKYQAIVNEMVGALISSGLYECAERVCFTVASGNDCDGPIDLWWTKLGINTNQVISLCKLNDGEAFTIGRLRDASISQPDRNFLYIHTKGVANGSDNPCIDEWRRYMTHFCVGQWKRCNNLLQIKDAVGVDWAIDPAPHFSGNFWWGAGRYLSKLKPIKDTPVILSDRHRSEFWIGTGNPLVFSLHDCGVSVYERHLHNYPFESYSK